jgi:hypothetical protein
VGARVRVGVMVGVCGVQAIKRAAPRMKTSRIRTFEGGFISELCFLCIRLSSKKQSETIH